MSEWERWQGRYAVPDYIFGEEPNAFLAAQKHRLPAVGEALAVADGEGRNGVFLAQQGLDALSIDFSPHGQAKARALAMRRGVRLETRLADLHTFDWPEAQFDVIADIFTQFSAPADRAVKFAGIRKALKPGGLLLIEGYTPRQLRFGTGGPKAVEQFYTMDLLEEAFGGFSTLLIREYDAVLAEASAHAGPSALIDLVAWK